MATRALDVITVLYALQTLDHELTVAEWQPQNPAQREVFAWLGTYQSHLGQITGLEAKASRFYEDLNAFLADKGFSLRLEPLDPTIELGVVSVLDKLVRWLNGPGTLSDIATSRGAMPGFELPATGVHVYGVEGYPGSYLLELLTQSDETLWLFVHQDTSVEGLGLMQLALDVMGRSRQTPMGRVPQSWGGAYPTFGGARIELGTSWLKRALGLLRRSRQSTLRSAPAGGAYPTFAGAKVPMIDFDLTPDLKWLLGAGLTTKPGGHYAITQALQQFKLRMDETGARVKVATALAPSGAMHYYPTVFLVDRPFYGWWTQRGVDLPMAVFFADWDCWRKPAGALEDM